MADIAKRLTVPEPVKRVAEVAVILAISAALVLLIILCGNAFATHSTPVQSFQTWLAFIRRPDIIATALLAVIVTMAVSAYRSRYRR